MQLSRKSVRWLWFVAGFLPLVASASHDAWVPLRDGFNGVFLRELVSPSLVRSTVRWSAGDDAARAQPSFDDRGWNVADLLTLPSHTGVFWVRFRVRDAGQPLPSGVYVQATMAYDLYWDGVYVGRSGVPGNSAAEEKTGFVDAVFTLPEALRGPGEHVVALRASNYRDTFPGEIMPMRFMPIEPSAHQTSTARSNLGPTIAIGASLMLGLTAFVMWLVAARQRVLLLFALMCFSVAVMQATLVARFVFGYTYEWHFWAWMALRNSAWACSILLFAVVLAQFTTRLRALWLLVPAAVVIVLDKNYCGVPFLLLGPALAAFWAVFRRRRGAWFVALGTIGSFLLWRQNPPMLLGGHFFQVVLPTIIGLTIAIAIDVRAQRRQAREAQLAAARLEVELLKKNIQPHFLLNTLATLIEVIEQEPKSAVALIQALATEFRVLARMSGQKLVPLEEELELCRAHLAVMSLRKGARCALRVSGDTSGCAVPPALLHTLVENGLTHLLPRDGRLDFVLVVSNVAGGQRFVLHACGVRQVEPATETPREGTGLRYVKARLEESFTGRWTLQGQPVADGWQTVIEIAAAAPRHGSTEVPAAAFATKELPA